MHHSPPATNIAAITAARCGASGTSSANTSTTVSTLPIAAAARPYTRAYALQKITAQPSGTTTGMPSGRSIPKTAQIAAPTTVKTSSPGTRLRIGPPTSQKHVRFAASAM